ncbi:MAG: hypothetical protein AAGO57_09500, partial [Pseudomonadota bacterium]
MLDQGSNVTGTASSGFGAPPWAYFAAAEIYAFVRRPDVYLGLFFRALKAGRLARVSKPETADEKFLWRKIFDRDPRFPVFSDKLAAKDWVASLGLPIDIPKTFWIGTDAAAIPRAELRPGRVLKTNNATSTNLFF